MRNAPAEIVPQYGEELCKAGFTVELDRDNCDYLYSRNDLALLKGKAFHKKKNLVNQFLKLYDKDVRELDDLTTKDAFSVLDKWKQHRLEEGGDDGDFEQCTLALKNRVFLDLKGIVVYAFRKPFCSKFIYCLINSLNFGNSLFKMTYKHFFIRRKFPKTKS